MSRGRIGTPGTEKSKLQTQSVLADEPAGSNIMVRARCREAARKHHWVPIV